MVDSPGPQVLIAGAGPVGLTAIAPASNLLFLLDRRGGQFCISGTRLSALTAPRQSVLKSRAPPWA
jgi:2-polyprenyl-6-methoxyphenol hydroxylase-like FAD-dependent oxidoreductase